MRTKGANWIQWMFFGFVGLAVAAFSTPGFAGLIEGGGKDKPRQGTDCLAELSVDPAPNVNGQTVTCSDCDANCDQSATAKDGQCIFQVALCVNQKNDTACSETPLKKVTAVVKRVKGLKRLQQPSTLATSSCGAFANVPVKLGGSGKNKGKKPGSATIVITATSTGTGKARRIDKDTFKLVCNPPASVCATTTTTTTSTTTTTLHCDNLCSTNNKCGSPTPTKLRFVTVAGSGTCGTIKDATGTAVPKECSGAGTPCNSNTDCGPGQFCAGPDLMKGGLYFGGGGVGVPLPAAVPDQGVSLTNVTCCDSETGNMNLAASTAAETGSNLNCTSTNCLFGAPLPVPNPNAAATSTCIVNQVSADASGTGNCISGDSNIALPLSSIIYLTADLLDGSASDRPDIAGLQPCPICVGSPAQCVGGPNHGLACTPQDSASLGNAFPTSHDCPPPPGTLLGTLPIAFNLTTKTATMTAIDRGTGGQNAVETFCAFCSRPDTGTPHKTPMVPCTQDSDCANVPKACSNTYVQTPCNTNADCPSGTVCKAFSKCLQRDPGAFAHGFAHSYEATGEAAGSLVDGGQHPSTLVSVFCIPPVFSALVDGAADLPGPGAVCLPGNAQLLP